MCPFCIVKAVNKWFNPLKGIVTILGSPSPIVPLFPEAQSREQGPCLCVCPSTRPAQGNNNAWPLIGPYFESKNKRAHFSISPIIRAHYPVLMDDSATCNVRVAVRVRPLNAREHLAGSNEVLIVGSDGRSLLAAPDRQFSFDHVYGTGTEQTTIFEELARPVLTGFMEGFNCTIFAYGQTGSGKTFTMGTSLDECDRQEEGGSRDSTLGIVPRAIQLLLERLEETTNKENGEWFELYVSFLELYNEEIIDLLNASSQDRLDRSKRPVLTIREDPNGTICIAGIREERALSPAHVLDLLRQGSLCRTTKSTDMNLVSSRSHAIFTLLLRQRRIRYEADGTLRDRVTCSKLHFVDLAGSERLKRTNVSGERARESISINSGLLALGNVISALGDETKRATHVPYRDSKLTRLLQDSLGGNSRTVMVACVSPSSDNYNETVNTLKYANRARNIRNNAQVNEANGDSANAAFEIMQLKKQVAALKTEILQLRGLGVRRHNVGGEVTAVASTPSRSSVHGGGGGELERLRTQLRDATRRITTLSKEKITIEAERDFYKSAAGPPSTKDTAIREHLKSIADLKSRLVELEIAGGSLNGGGLPSAAPSGGARRRLMSASGAISAGPGRGNSSRGPPSSIGGGSGGSPRQALAAETPSWFGKATCLIDRTRQEIRANEAFLESLRGTGNPSKVTASNDHGDDHSNDDDAHHHHDNDNDTDTDDATNNSGARSSKLSAESSSTPAVTSQALETLLNDQTLKEELIVSLENGQQEYLVMRRKYEDRLRLLQENIHAITRERDQAITKHLSNSNAAAASSAGRARLEERLRQMGRIIEELRGKNAEHAREAGTRATAHDTLVRNLRSALANAKSEKARMQARLEEMQNTRTRSPGTEGELAQARARERRAEETARRLKKAYDFQKSLLHKRSEQYLASKTRIRQLVHALRKHRVPLSPSLSTLLDTPSGSVGHASGAGAGNGTGTGLLASNRTGTRPGSVPDTPTRPYPSSGLASRCISAADLVSNVSTLHLQEAKGSRDRNGEPGLGLGLGPRPRTEQYPLPLESSAPPALPDSPLLNPILEPDEIELENYTSGGPCTPRSLGKIASTTGANGRRVSLIEEGKVFPGRSVLRMSPLFPRHHDIFSQLADSASKLAIARQLQLQQQPSPSPPLPPRNDDGGSPFEVVSRRSEPSLTASPMKIDGRPLADVANGGGRSMTDILEFYRNRSDDHHHY